MTQNKDRPCRTGPATRRRVFVRYARSPGPNTDESAHDFMGRQFYVRLSQQF